MEDLTPQDSTLFQEVYVPAFVAKCAAAGIKISDDQSLKEALETTALVLQHMQSKQSNVIKSAHASLRQVLGVTKKEAALNEQHDRLKSAFQVGKDPKIREAILSSVQKTDAA